MIRKLLFILLLPLSISTAQVYDYAASIGKFTRASAFHISPSGFIYVTDRGTNQIIKLDTLGERIKENGGFGWKNETFDDPSGVYASSLNVFVCDRNNHRVQFFDKDLNYFSQLKTKDSGDPEMEFGYPISVTINKQGDLFVLDSENHRILKFDLFGNFIQNFGGYNYGKYSLTDPVKLAADPYNNIFAADADKIVIFDQYGNGIKIITAPETIQDINIIFDEFSIISGGKILTSRIGREPITLNPVTLNNYEEGGAFLSSMVFNGKLYVLTSKKIDVFTRTGK